MDIAGKPDIKHDLFTFPWPLKDECATEVYCSHFFEHIPGMIRGQWMDELYRVMQFDAKATIICPYGQSNRAVQDFTHRWPPVMPESFLYFNAEWRRANLLTHGSYDLKCDFDFTYGYSVTPQVASRNEEYKVFALTHYINAASDIQVTLIKTRRNEAS